MISKFHVENFKSLRDVTLKFDDLTLLYGHNNSGKSAAIESLMYYIEAAECNARSTADIPRVDFVGYDFSDPNQLFFRNGNEVAEEFVFEPTFDIFQNNHTDDLLDLMNLVDVDEPLLKYATKLSKNNLEQHVQFSEGETNEVTLMTADEQLTGDIIDFQSPIVEGDTFRASNDGFLDLSNVAGVDAERLVNTMTSIVREELQGTHYITDTRDIKDFDADPEEQEFVGYDGENTVAMLHALRDDEDAFQSVVEAMDDIAQDTRSVEADMYGKQTRTELVDSDTNERFNIVGSGSGFRRLLPIIVQIAAMDSGGTLLLEEPEISVHPTTQKRFLEFLLEAIETKDIQVIMSTHSVPFLWNIQNEAVNDLGHGIRFDKRNGQSEVQHRPFDEIYDQDFFPDFED